MHFTLEDVWARLETELFLRWGAERHEEWVRNARPHSLDEEELIVSFETTYARSKFMRFRASVIETVRRLTNRKIRVRFRVDGDSFTRPPAAALRDETRRPRILHLPPQTFGTFLEGPGNQEALRAVRAFASEPPPLFRSLLIQAASGLGKTHLLRAAADRLSRYPGLPVLLFTGEQFARHFHDACLRGHREAFLKRCRHARILLFDDLHLLAWKDEAQRAFLETVLALEARGGRFAITCECPPGQVEGLARPLKHRLRPDWEVTLGPPDPATSAAFLRACAPPGTPPAALDYLAAHIRTSYKDQLSCLSRLLELGPPTLAGARAVAREFLNRWSGGLTYDDIARASAEYFGVTVAEIYSSDRSRAAIEARRACYYLSRKLLRLPYARIGEHFGGRDHATVLNSCRRLSRKASTPDRSPLHRLEERLTAAALHG